MDMKPVATREWDEVACKYHFCTDGNNEELLFSEGQVNFLKQQLAASQQREKVLREALENCRLFAARRRAEEWATHILRFCESGGSVANPLRQDDSALRELLKAERERCAKVLDERAMKNEQAAQDCLQNGEPDEVSSLRSAAWQLSVCAAAIRAMEDQ